MDQRFGRAVCFIVMDTDTMSFEPIDNGCGCIIGEAGLHRHRRLWDKGIGAVITGNVGPNAMNVLKGGTNRYIQRFTCIVKRKCRKVQEGIA
jgi:predicted Fe-Mo cluster-binding NifX family protein